LQQYITRKVKRECEVLKKKFEEWAAPRIEIARVQEPKLPFSGSLYDKTETLVTTGQMLDLTDENVTHFTDATHFTHLRGWGKMVIEDAVEGLKEAQVNEEESDGLQLIRDCITAINGQREYGFFHNSLVPTTTKDNKLGGWALYDAVIDMPEAKWATYNFGHKPITIREFCKMLTSRGIKRPGKDNDGVIRIREHTVRGWDLAAFIDPAKNWFDIDIKDEDMIKKIADVTDVIGATEVTPVTDNVKKRPKGWTPSDDAWETACGRPAFVGKS
jgi:hypothetical protein